MFPELVNFDGNEPEDDPEEDEWPEEEDEEEYTLEEFD
jgi:hypothetical protein